MPIIGQKQVFLDGKAESRQKREASEEPETGIHGKKSTGLQEVPSQKAASTEKQKHRSGDCRNPSAEQPRTQSAGAESCDMKSPLCTNHLLLAGCRRWQAAALHPKSNASLQCKS